MFRSASLAINPTTSFGLKSTVFIIYETIMIAGLLVLYYQGLTLNNKEKDYGESFMTHVVRIALLLLGTFVTFVVISVILLFIVLSIAIGCDKWCYYRRSSASRQMRNNNLKLLSKLRNIPYGSLVFQEAIDCSICYETFKND